MRCSATSEVASRPATTVLVLVRLSSGRARKAERDDCHFAKKQQPPRALLVVAQSSGAHARGPIVLAILGPMLERGRRPALCGA
jgi:hypothetical protein